MHRVSALLPSWDKTKIGNTNNPNATVAHRTKPSLAALDKVFLWTDKSNASTNSNSNAAAASSGIVRFGREAYWPKALDEECNQAARILKSFCTDGFLALEDEDPEPSSPTEPSTPRYIAKKIPPRIVQNAVGLAIFSCMRSGLWMSGAGGTGILIARKADGTWSPPSGILLHTAPVGFVAGVDIYDCVLVINSVAALETFTRPRVALGSDVSLTVGPLIPAGSLAHDLKWKELSNTVLTFLKARGKHQHARLDGSLVTERANENERFYAGSVDVLDILAGNINKSIPELRPLFEVIKAAEGRSDFDPQVMDFLSQQPAPSDVIIEAPKSSPLSPPKSPFGIPRADDPDPFGVVALEMAGLEIREAGTRLRPQSNQFEFNPLPTSPVFSKFSRQSTDTYVSRSNRASLMSNKTQATAVTDAGTQTEDPVSPETTSSDDHIEDGQEMTPEKLPTVVEPVEVDYTKIDISSVERLKPRVFEVTTGLAGEPDAQEGEGEKKRDQATATDNADVDRPSTQLDNEDERDEDADDEDDEDADDEDEEDEDEEAIVYEVATAAAPTRTTIASTKVAQVIQAKGSLVTIPKRLPPPLPARSPARTSRASKSEYGDVSSLKSPLRNSFQSDAHSDRAPTPAVDGAVATAEAGVASTQPQEDQGEESGSTNIIDQEPNERPLSAATNTSEKRWSTGSNNPPSTPKTSEAVSTSAEDSDHEPKTPKAELRLQANTSQHEKPATEGEIDIIPHHDDSTPIAVA